MLSVVPVIKDEKGTKGNEEKAGKAMMDTVAGNVSRRELRNYVHEGVLRPGVKLYETYASAIRLTATNGLAWYGLCLGASQYPAGSNLLRS